MFRTSMISVALMMAPAVGQTESKQNRPDREALQPLDVRIYDYAQAPPDVLAEAKRVAGSIFQKIGVNVRWTDHSFLEPSAAVLAQEPTKIQLRILSRRMAERLPLNKMMTGLTFQGTRGQAGRVANVFYHRVQELAKQGICSQGEILGHAVAHELGHLLLGTVDHSQAGLMKAQLGPKELKRAARGDLVFTDSEGIQIRQAAETRSEP